MTRFARLPSFKFAGLATMIRFGLNVTGGRVLSYLNNEADTMLIGRFLGSDALGLFSVARHITRIPAAKVMSIVNEVSFPAFANIQEERQRVQAGFLRIIETACFLFLPIFLGLSAVSADFVAIVLGEKWAGTDVIIEMLCFLMALHVISLVMDPVLGGVGRPDVELRNQLTILVFRVPALVIGLQWSLLGVAVALVLSYVPSLAINFLRSAPAIGVRLSDILSRIARPLFISGAMYLAVRLSGDVFLDAWQPAWRLAALVPLGAACYLAMIAMFNRAILHDLMEFVGSAKATNGTPTETETVQPARAGLGEDETLVQCRRSREPS